MAPRYEVLPGLPGTGPYPEQFSQGSTHREGLVVRVLPELCAPWVGNFQPGLSRFSMVFVHPDERHLVVVASGLAYVVNPETRELTATVGGQIENAIEDSARRQVLLSNGLWFEALRHSRQGWKRSRRVSWDGVTDLRIDGEALHGQAWALADTWAPFVLHLDTGEVDGGSYDDK